MIDKTIWMNRKKEYIERISRDKEIGYLDPGIEVYLNTINRREKSFTTSSCIGRITIIDAEYPWERKNSTVLFKKHDYITKEELASIITLPPNKRFWMITSGPILHINCLDIDEALYILDKARKSGFKHSGIMNISKNGIMIELISGTQFTIPLRTREDILFKKESLEKIVNLANNTLKEGRKRLEKLKKALEEDGS